MKHTAWAAMALAGLALAACHNEQPYTISGEFDFPMTFEYGDTTLERPSFEGMKVYLYDLHETVVDSTTVDADEHFSFTGTVDRRKPYFLFLVSEIASGMVIVEPGDISVVIDEDLTATGTPLNDGITDINAAVSNFGQDMAEQFSALNDSLAETDALEGTLMDLYTRAEGQFNQMLDSFYTAHPKDLIGVYAIHYKTAQTQSAAELEQALADYDDYVRQSELMQMRLDYYREIEQQYGPLTGDDADFDPSIFDSLDEGQADQADAATAPGSQPAGPEAAPAAPAAK